MTRIIRIGVLLLLTAAFAGCASIDFDYPRTTSTAISAANDTALADKYSAAVAKQPSNQSGFHTLLDGMDALAARLQLAEAAETSIDLQYYLIKDDIVGRGLLHALLRAADRGVRVRLLLDDVFTSGYDAGMAALQSHPNFEIRIYNPFNRGIAGRPLGALGNFGRVNRRMHNKSFTVDNRATIIGGRNIAGEYFAARKDINFGDLDVMAVGPVVQDVSNMFDLYWNHETALPVAAFNRKQQDNAAVLDRLREDLKDAYENVPETQYRDAVHDRFDHFVSSGAEIFTWSEYQLVFDSPDKGLKKHSDQIAQISIELVEELIQAEEQLIIISPYFVPRHRGVDAIKAVHADGVDVVIVTNSLAANNQFSVHAGYAPSRVPLLQAGVRIFEVRPDSDIAGAELVAASGAKATLHMKAFVVDRKEAFIGSFNFDPRSAYLNTEMGVIIKDPMLATRMADQVFAKLPIDTYELFLNEDGDLRWRGYDNGVEVIYDKEPQSTWWDRFKVGFVRLLPLRSQL